MTDLELIEAVNQVFIESFEIPPEKLTPEDQIFADLGFEHSPADLHWRAVSKRSDGAAAGVC